MTGKQALRVEKITSLEEFSALQAECNMLETFSIDNIFLTPTWLSLWWEVYKGNCQLNILAVRDGASLIGLLPLVLQRNFGTPRRLVFMGSGELTPNDMDVLSIPGRQNDVLQALAAYLFENRSEWNVLELDKLPCVGKTSEFLVSYFKSQGWTTELTCTAHCFSIDLPISYDAYLASLPKSKRHNLHRVERSLEYNFPEMELVCVGTADQAEQALLALTRLHQARWTQRGYPGSFASQRFCAFNRQIVKRTLNDGSLQMYYLQFRSEIIGVLYCFLVKDIMQCYMTGFDERWASYSLGSILINKVVDVAIQKKVRIFDFLEGEEKYKEEWGCEPRENMRLRIYAPGLSSRFAYLVSRLTTAAMEWALRHIPDNIRHSARKAFLRWRISQRNKDYAGGGR